MHFDRNSESFVTDVFVRFLASSTQDVIRAESVYNGRIGWSCCNHTWNFVVGGGGAVFFLPFCLFCVCLFRIRILWEYFFGTVMAKNRDHIFRSGKSGEKTIVHCALLNAKTNHLWHNFYYLTRKSHPTNHVSSEKHPDLLSELQETKARISFC